MILEAYCIYDVKAQSFCVPFFSPVRALALRNVSAAVRDESTLLGKFPEDYVLYFVGRFDDELGVLQGSTAEVVCQVLSLKGVSDA